MDADRWRQISALYHEARGRTQEDRRAFLDAACGDDGVLRQELDTLLADDSRAETFLAAPVAALVAELAGSDAEPVGRGLKPGDILGTYRIERLLGRGGMGAVFLAYDTRLHRQVALKVIDGDAGDAAVTGRVLREARNAAALNHPHICTIYEVGAAAGGAFIAMEYVGGPSLRERINAGPLRVADVLALGLQAADALAYAHAHGVVHRDFKAANAMLTEDGRLKVVDFGLARRADALLAQATTLSSMVPAGTAAGTPYAMAPEQVRGEPADARTDIWALGVLLYEMVAGTRPFTAATTPELFSTILTVRPAPLPATAPVELRALIECCLEKDPAHRYQTAAEVRSALESIEAHTVPPWVAWRYRLRRRPGIATAAGLLALVAGLVGGNVGGLRDRLRGPPVAPPVRLAVLPFENLTGDPEQEYFSDGLTDELITQLGRLHPQSLSVIARTSSMRYKGRDTPLAQIGRELDVAYVLEGGVRREADRVRVSATLVEVEGETQRWAESFDRDVAGILALQHDVARGVARSLALTLLPEEQARLAGARPVNPEAYEAYRRGMFHVQRQTRPDLDLAQQYFDVALQKDPDYAPAYAGIAGVWNSRNFRGYVPPGEAAPRAKAAALKALELDGALAHAHRAIALVAWAEFDWETSDREYSRSIELDPGDPSARAAYSQMLFALRRPGEAIAHAERALHLDPLSPNRQTFYGSALYFVRRYDEAVIQLQNAARAAPDSPVAHCGLWHAYNMLGRPAEALMGAEGCIGFYGPEVKDALARGYSEGGYRGAMRRVADLLASGISGGHVAPVDVFIAYLHAGEKNLALGWLSKAVDSRDPQLYGAAADPFAHDSLGDDPRFREILRRAGLPM